MSIPSLFFGHNDNGTLMRVGVGYVDLDQAYVPMVISNPGVPLNGTQNEHLFSAIYLSVNQRAEPVAFGDPFEEADILVTPIVDGVELETETVTVRMQPINPGVPPKRVTRTYEIGVSLPFMRGEVEAYRYSPQGRFFQVKIVLPSTEIQVLEAKVEYRPTTDALTPVNAGAA